MTTTKTVVVADRDIERLNARVEQLRLDGFETELAPSGDQARRLLPHASVLVLADVGGGPAAAFALIREIRAGALASTPKGLATITFADGDSHFLSSFRAGADMTLPTGASPMLVSASVEALDRRRWGPQTATGTVRLGRLELDVHGRTASVDGADVTLTARQFELLEALAKVPGKVYSRDELSQEIWGAPEIRGSRAIDAHLSRLGRRLGEAGAAHMIQNVRGRGFKLGVSGAER